MIKKLFFPMFMILIILTLAGCNATSTPTAQVTLQNVPITLVPSQTVPATETPLPPTETSTSAPPTETATTVPITPTATLETGNAIQHFPSGQQLTVTDIHMVDATTGWAIGGLDAVGDHVLFTSDGGNTWKDVTPPEVQAANGDRKVATGFFQDAQSAWMTFGISGGMSVPAQAVVWRTSNSGATWQASQPLDLTNLNELYVPSNLQFVSGQDGWLLVHVGVGMMHDYVVIYHSTDGGASWSRILDPYNDGGIQSCSKTAMLFTDANHGWLTGDCQGVKAGVLLFSSIDSGFTWQEVTLPAPKSAPNLFNENASMACGSYDPFFFGNEVGILSIRCADYSKAAVTYSYYIYTTQDGGGTWSASSYTGDSLYFFTADSGWALSNKIQHTADGGLTWTTTSNVTWSATVDFISAQIGWGVAKNGDQVALVKTVDGGATWKELLPTVGQ